MANQEDNELLMLELLEEFRIGLLEVINNKTLKVENGKLEELEFTDDIEEKMCPIKLEKFTIGEKIIKLKCNHYFNKESILIWLKKNTNCPCCRKEVKQVKENIPQLIPQLYYNLILPEEDIPIGHIPLPEGYSEEDAFELAIQNSLL